MEEGLVALLALSIPALAQAQAEPKPNILIIWGDDIGDWNVSALFMQIAPHSH